MRFVQPTRIIFITGTDTGVGKTVLTSLLISHLHQTGSAALAIKSFCSGGRADAELLQALQPDSTLDAINPFYFSEPLAPLIAARNENRQISFDITLHHVRAAMSLLSKIQNPKSKIENLTLLIEGAGGLLSPLGEPKPKFKVQSSRFKEHSNCYTALDLITALRCQVIVVTPNRLGTLNHTLLTAQALKASKPREIKVVLMNINDHPSSRNTEHATPASRSNPEILAELLSPIPLFRIPYLTKNPSKPEQIHQFAKKLKKTLAQILA